MLAVFLASGLALTPAQTASPPPPGAPSSTAAQLAAQQASPAPTQATPAPATAPDDALQQEVTVTARRGPPREDPLESTNIKSYEVTRKVDEAVYRPVAMGYKDALPKPVRTGLRNLLRNIDEPVVFLNFLLQLKPGKAAETLGRFTVNTTVGIGGLVDVAKQKPINLPYRHNGLANTLGYYGVKPGAFLYLPFYGATTPRDLFGDVVDRFMLPLAVGFPLNTLAWSIPTTALRALDRRVEVDDQLRDMRANDPNPYVTARALYLRSRQAEIDALHGRGQGPTVDSPDAAP